LNRKFFSRSDIPNFVLSDIESNFFRYVPDTYVKEDAFRYLMSCAKKDINVFIFMEIGYIIDLHLLILNLLMKVML